MTTLRVISNLLIVQLVLFVLSALIRIPIMNDQNFARTTTRIRLRPIYDSFYHSALTQTTIGSTDLIPISMASMTIYAGQGLVALALAAGILVFR